MAFVNRTTFRNCSGETGTINNNGELFVSNSTFSGNTVTVRGAAVINSGKAHLEGVTIYGNSSTQRTCSDANCGALATAGGTLEVAGTIIANNTILDGSKTGNCSAGSGATITSLGYNIFGENPQKSCVVTAAPGHPDISPRDPQLFALAAHGGVGMVHLPAIAGPASNAAPASEPFCGFGDQRGLNRTSTFNGSCDIGAVEVGPALLVEANHNTPTIGDSSVLTAMTNLGLDVTTINDETVSTVDAGGKIVVVVAESCESAQVNTKFRDVTTGVLVLEPSILDDMRMTGPTQGTHYGTTSGQMQLNVGTQSSIGLSAGYTGTLDVTTSNAIFMWGVPSSSAQGTLINSTRAGMFQYSRFEALPGAPAGSTAAGRRVSLFATDNAAGVLSQQGRRLLEEAIISAAF